MNKTEKALLVILFANTCIEIIATAFAVTTSTGIFGLIIYAAMFAFIFKLIKYLNKK